MDRTHIPRNETRSRGHERPDLATLAACLREHAPHDGSFELALPGVHAVRVSRPNADLVHSLHGPTLCVVAQGAKSVMVGEELYRYDASHMLLFSVDVPIAAQVLQASPGRPYLCFKLDLQPGRIAPLVAKVYPKGLPPVRDTSGVWLTPANEFIVDAAARLLALMSQPDDLHLLGPLVVDEILIRLLRSPVGGRLAQLGQVDSQFHRVAKAVTWVRDNYAEPLRIDHLAERFHMSASTLHQRFKAVTAMSPLQYQKVLRLQEARRLMMAAGVDANVACRQVGYASASQFSREYARLFGKPPRKDVPRGKTSEATAS